jgi:hypothetical protein
MRRWRRQAVADDHVADVGDARLAAERERLLSHHLHAVVLLWIVRSGDLDPAFELVAGHGEIQHVRRDHAVVDHVRALRGHTVQERGRQRGRREAHVPAESDTLRLEVGDERRTDRTGSVLVDLARVHATDIVGLEDVGIHVHRRL